MRKLPYTLPAALAASALAVPVTASALPADVSAAQCTRAAA